MGLKGSFRKLKPNIFGDSEIRVIKHMERGAGGKRPKAKKPKRMPISKRKRTLRSGARYG